MEGYVGWLNGRYSPGLPPKLSAVGAHVYAGGFAVGVSRHFMVRAHFEELDAGTEVFQDNFPGAEVHRGPRASWPTAAYEGVDLAYFNPPCAPWSEAARGNQGEVLRASDPRVAYAYDCVDAALAMRPKVFILESVTGILKRGGAVLIDFTSRLHAAGYAVTFFLTNACMHGVPQSRARFHLVAHLVPFDPEAMVPPKSNVVTVRQAIGDIDGPLLDGSFPDHAEFPNEGWVEYIVNGWLQGESAYDARQRLLAERPGTIPDRPRPSFLYKRLRYDAPSNAVLDPTRLFHPEQSRCLTVREAARLCSYPDWFSFRMSRRDRVRHDVAQAVTPGVAEALAAAAARGIASGERAAYADGPLPDRVIDLRPAAAELLRATKSGNPYDSRDERRARERAALGAHEAMRERVAADWKPIPPEEHEHPRLTSERDEAASAVSDSKPAVRPTAALRGPQAPKPIGTVMPRLSGPRGAKVEWTIKDGESLRLEREAAGISVADMAAACGVTYSRVREVEKAFGWGKPSGPSARLLGAYRARLAGGGEIV